MKIRIHLSTAIIAQIVAALLLVINMRPEWAALKGESLVWSIYGWPFRVCTVEYYGDDIKSVMFTDTRWGPLLGNIAVALLIIFGVVLILELRIHIKNNRRISVSCVTAREAGDKNNDGATAREAALEPGKQRNSGNNAGK